MAPDMLRRHAIPAIAAALSCCTPADAQTYTVQSITPPAFGNVASGATGNTVLRNTGTVTKLSGSGAWISGTVARATITINCTNGVGAAAACSNAANNARIRVGSSGIVSGRALAFTDLTASPGSGTIGTGTTSGAGPLDFTLTGWTGPGPRTFFIDTTLPIAGDDVGGTAGAATSGFYVYAAKDPTVPSTGLTGLATANVRRSLQMVKQSDLQLGAVVRPLTSSGTVTIDATSGGRTAGGASPPALLPGLASGRAAYLITGQAGTSFTITVPASVALASGANTIALTLTPTTSGSQNLPGGGTLTLGVGGSATIATSTPQGDYSGTFTVTISYN